MMPLERYFRMPCRVVGRCSSTFWHLNCRPYCGCSIHSPVKMPISPPDSIGSVPTTVTVLSPIFCSGFTVTTEYPFSALRYTVPSTVASS